MSKKFIEFDSDAKAAMKFDGPNILSTVTGGQASNKGVVKGWTIININGKSAAGKPSKDITTLIRNAKKEGPTYKIQFMVPRASTRGAKATTPVPKKGVVGKKGAKGGVKKKEEEAKKAEEKKAAEETEAKKKEEEEAAAKAAEEEAKRKEEDEKKAVEEAVAAAAEAAAAAAAAEQAKRNGDVTVKYELYEEKFEINDGSCTAFEVDDRFALSFVMPNCSVHLCEMSPKDRMEGDELPDYDPAPFLCEEPTTAKNEDGDTVKTFKYMNLETGKTYYAFVNQDPKEEERERAKMAKRRDYEKNAAKSAPPNSDDGRECESCSCLEGNPCVDEYQCKDWYNRWAVAKKNGWKGF